MASSGGFIRWIHSKSNKADVYTCSPATMAVDSTSEVVTDEWTSIQVIFHSITVIVGIPFNLFIASVLVFSRKLHNARNLMWLMVILCDLLVLFVVACEYFAIYLQNPLACRIVATLKGKSYLLLLINLLLITFERLMYIKYPLVHRRQSLGIAVMGVQFICIVVAAVLLIPTFMVMDMPYRCDSETGMFHMVTGATFVVATVSTVAIFFLYSEIKYAQRGSRKAIVLSENVLSAIFSIGAVNIEEEEIEMAAPGSSRRRRLANRFGPRQTRLNQWNATLIVIVNALPLIFTLLWACLVAFGLCLCSIVEGNCTMNFEVFSRELGLLHVSTNLIAYVVRSPEFRPVAQEWLEICEDNIARRVPNLPPVVPPNAL